MEFLRQTEVIQWIEASEELLDCETLINAAVDGVETIFVS